MKTKTIKKSTATGQKALGEHTECGGRLTKGVSLFIIPAVLLAFLVIVSPATADSACSSSGVPVVSTDKEDYAPGETVVITGQGFQCGASLTVKVTRPDGSVVKGDGTFSNGSDTVIPDSTGAFTYNYKLDGISGTYIVEVIDAAGTVLATTTFIDTHFRFGHLSWKQTGSTKVQFESVQGWRKSAFGVSSVGQTLNLDSNYNTGGGSPSNVNPLYTVTFIDSANDWFLAKATFNVTYPGLGPYTIYATSCCRISPPRHINNPDKSWRTEGIVNMNNGNTASPKSSLPVIVDCAKNSVCNFAVVAVDPDISPGGQNLRWRMGTSAEMGGSNLVQPGPTKAPNAASVNAITGVYTWNTTGATLSTDGTTLYSTQVVIEDRTAAGALISKSPIDFFVRIVPQSTNNPPQFVAPSPTSGTVFSITAGQNLAFIVKAQDADTLNLVTLNAIGLPTGASFTLPAPANPVQSTFSWTPTVSQIGSYALTFTASDGTTTTTLNIGINVGALGNSKSAIPVSGPNPPEVGATSFFDVFIDLSVPAASPGPVTGINVIDPLSAGVTFQGNLAATHGTISYDAPNNRVVWTGTNLNPGQSAQAQFRVSVTPTSGDLGNSLPLNQGATATGSFGGLPITVVSNTLSTNPVTLPSNQPPTANAGGPYSVPEGGSVNLAGSGTDPNNDPLTFTWDMDNDGNFETAGQNPMFSAVGRDGPSSQTVILKVCDNKGACTTSSTLVNINNAAPAITLVTNDGPIGEGGSATIVVTATDPAGANDPLSYQFDCNNDGIFEGVPQTTATASCSFTDDGSFQVNVQVTDDDSGIANDFTIVTVNNVAPTVNAGADATIDEGSAFSSSGSFSDPGADTWTATVDYGDGSGVQALALNPDKSFALNHAYADNGVYTVTVTVADDDLGSGSDTATVTVNNVAPAVNAGSDATIDEGSTFSSSGSFSDPGADTWNAIVDYGDGSGAQPLTLTGNNFALSHVYADNGAYTVTVTVTDDDLGTGSDTATVTVNNVAPTVTLNPSYYVTVPITLRIAGQGKVGNSVELQVIQDGAAIATSGKVIRTPGSPNEQEVTLSAAIDLSKPYSGRLIFDTETAISGGTPVWVIIDGNMTKVTTFNTQKNDPSSYHQTYDFALAGLVSIVGKELTFKATASDPGTDDLTFDWDFGDGGVLSNPYPWSGSHTMTDTVKHTYTAAGTYAVSLKVTDDDGGVGSDSKTIQIS